MNDQTFYLYVADGATHVGEPSDPAESERVEWAPVHDVVTMVRDGQVRDGLSLTALSLALLFELPTRKSAR